MGGIGAWEIAIIVIVLVLLFGAKKLPDMARGLGRSMRVFKSEIAEMQNDGKAADKPAEQVELPPADRPSAADDIASEPEHKKSA
ncbi:Sec-independent protein translocase subunit TatA [Gordonia alkaliphila]|uniref:Sec-independent protein translocase subunit TatA n=1 Tax=Gordonia alkaliphila TaxID=1053547 RepID=UPI001FF3931F|nr:Sec-independent protein translocase subunit TatA [Gordonia alkaliphila]MCK0440719.1 Sec-independent protein translocase subunit TatA [Gordonia alkaliphila]